MFAIMGYPRGLVSAKLSQNELKSLVGEAVSLMTFSTALYSVFLGPSNPWWSFADKDVSIKEVARLSRRSSSASSSSNAQPMPKETSAPKRRRMGAMGSKKM